MSNLTNILFIVHECLKFNLIDSKQIKYQQ